MLGGRPRRAPLKAVAITAYYARVLKADVPLALDVIADILLNPLFEQTEIEVERGVILQEIGETQDTPSDLVFDQFQEAAFPNQAIGRSILGSEAVIEAVNSAKPAASSAAKSSRRYSTLARPASITES